LQVKGDMGYLRGDRRTFPANRQRCLLMVDLLQRLEERGVLVEVDAVVPLKGFVEDVHYFLDELSLVNCHRVVLLFISRQGSCLLYNEGELFFEGRPPQTRPFSSLQRG